MTLALAGVKAGLVVSDPKSAGVSIPTTSRSAVLQDSLVHRSKGRGIGDFGTSSKLLRLAVIGNGHDGQPYNGDGILAQGRGTEIGWCHACDNGDSPEYEHGVYVAGPARGVWIHHLFAAGNACSGVKFAGTGTLEDSTLVENRYGVVLSDDQPGAIVVRRNRIRAAQFAFFVTANCRLERVESDDNTFGPDPRFRLPGRTVDLAGWRAATGQDLHSTIAA